MGVLHSTARAAGAHRAPDLDVIASILLAMGSVVGEKDSGTAAFVLTKPATRLAFLGARFCGLAPLHPVRPRRARERPGRGPAAGDWLWPLLANRAIALAALAAAWLALQRQEL